MFDGRLCVIVLDCVLLVVTMTKTNVTLVVARATLVLNYLFLVVSLFFVETLMGRLGGFGTGVEVFLSTVRSGRDVVLFGRRSTSGRVGTLDRSLGQVGRLLTAAGSRDQMRRGFCRSLLRRMPGKILT